MVWLVVGFGGRSNLVFIKVRRNHKECIQNWKQNLSLTDPIGEEKLDISTR